MATIYIDNVPYEVKMGKNLLESCLTLGFNLPYFCWHPSLGSVGACRQCAVKVFKDEKDTKGRLIMSCMEPVREALRLSVHDLEAKEFREHVIEWLMTNHPHDCAVCDEGGSCHLQDMTVMTGHAHRQYNYKKRTYQNQYLGPFLNHEMNRCIQCYRCVRFYKDYAGGKDLDVFAAHNHVYFGRHEDGVLENEFSGNLAEVCPTGVFTDKTLKQHYTRKWDLTMAPSICQHCSVGCNIIAGERYGSLRQITNRYNGEVNGYFICDRGRFGYEFVNSLSRVRKPMVRNQQPEAVSKGDALRQVAQIVKKGKIIGIGSPRASLESNFALQTLVGEDNFHHGVSDTDHDMVDLTLRLLRETPAHIASLKDVEKADAVFILGEDLTNTAPMLALAVRQSVRQQPLEQVAQSGIPVWQDAAARELIQDQKGPLFIASIQTTKLDEIATQTFYSPPDNIARLGFAVAQLIESGAPLVTHLSKEEQALAQQIAQALIEAKNPLVISGCSCGSESILKATANIAQALCATNKQASIVLTVPECNSLGLSMMGGHKLESAFEAMQNGYADTVIILENDLYRRANAALVEWSLQHCKQIIVLDHLHQRTSDKAHILLPAGTFAESDGTLVNNEGRAQRFYQVYTPKEEIQESWRWLTDIGKAVGNIHMSAWKTIDDVLQAASKENEPLKGIESISPPVGFRIVGQKIPREPHRYSGRTAINAQVNVSEPKPPEDPDSALSFTMEGYRGQAPSSMIPFYWSPGWNSGQAVNKYQEEIGGHLRNGDPGLRLIVPAAESKATYFTEVPEHFEALANHLFVVPLHHIFGSEELSTVSPGIAERTPAPYIAIHTTDAATLGVTEGQLLDFTIEGHAYHLPVKLSTIISKGTAGVPNGLPGVPYAELPSWAVLKQESTWKKQAQIIY